MRFVSGVRRRVRLAHTGASRVEVVGSSREKHLLRECMRLECMRLEDGQLLRQPPRAPIVLPSFFHLCPIVVVWLSHRCLIVCFIVHTGERHRLHAGSNGRSNRHLEGGYRVGCVGIATSYTPGGHFC